jgi:hypothetical protein
MLRLVDPKKYHIVTILDTAFQMRSMSVREKFTTIEMLSRLKPTTESYDQMIEHLCSVIASIDGRETKDVLNAVESFKDMLAIINGVIDYCSIKDEQSKNSDSSSDTSTPKPTGN